MSRRSTPPAQHNSTPTTPGSTGRSIKAPVPVGGGTPYARSPYSSAHAGETHMPPSGRAPQHRADEPKRHTGRIVAIVIVALLVVAYAAGAVAFSRICYPNTSIAGIDVSLMPRDQAIERAGRAAQDYRLAIDGHGFSWTFEPERGSDIFDAAQAVDRVLDANEPQIWPVRLAQALTGSSAKTSDHAGKTPALPDHFDRDGFCAELGAAIDAFNEGRTGTFDAAGAYDEAAGSFTVEKARSNQKLDPDALTDDALAAVAALNPTLTVDDDDLAPLAGGATDEQLQAACDAANALIGTNVNLTLGSDRVATLDGKQLAQWMTFDEALNPTLATDQVAVWAKELATQIDTKGTTRTYTRPDGKQISIGGGSYGWISDEAALVKQLQDAVANKQVGDIAIPTKQTAARFAGAGQADWGAYVDVDLSEQHARYYDAAGTLLWESPIISGNPNTGHATPTGVYKLNNKARNITLVGLDENNDNEPDYKTPVSYWMPFVGNAVGLHDANWQSSAAFADARAFTYRGSHGCVNLPPDKAAELYNIIEPGVCVVSHT